MIEDGLRALGYWHPGLFVSMQEAIEVLDAQAGVESIAVDLEEEDEVYPVTIWARTGVSLDEREALMERVDELTDAILEPFPNLVLVAVL